MYPKIDCSDDFMEMLKSCPDQLSKVIKGFYSLDILLNDVLSKKIPNSNALELDRVTFLLKFDITAGLGCVVNGMRPLFSNVNSIRNKFAHNPYTIYGVDEFNKTKKILLQSEVYRGNKIISEIDEPNEMLNIALFLCYAFIENGLKNIYRENKYWELINKRMEKLLIPNEKITSINKHNSEVEILLKKEFPKLFGDK